MKNTQAISALAALAQDTRLAIFRLLVERGPGGLAAGEIAVRLGCRHPRFRFIWPSSATPA